VPCPIHKLLAGKLFLHELFLMSLHVLVLPSMLHIRIIIIRTILLSCVQALQQNAQLLQKLQHLAAVQSSSTSSTPQPYLQQQTPTWHMMQVAMLRKALTVANMRLTAAGMMPVAATSDLLQDEVRAVCLFKRGERVI
jgi:hypothetical protein